MKKIKIIKQVYAELRMLSHTKKSFVCFHPCKFSYISRFIFCAFNLEMLFFKICLLRDVRLVCPYINGTDVENSCW